MMKSGNSYDNYMSFIILGVKYISVLFCFPSVSISLLIHISIMVVLNLFAFADVAIDRIFNYKNDEQA